MSIENNKASVKKVVLAYSGGLDTSAIIPWLKETYDNCEIVAFCADVGQGEAELEGLHEKAIASGASECYIVDLKEELVADYIYPTIATGAIYEGTYLLGTSMARPIIAKAQVEVARKVGADAVCHGCTGKGNDQVRFEGCFAALAPDLTVIAPWREWSMVSREDLLDYLAERNIKTTASATKIYSRDANAWHISHEGGELEDPWNEECGRTPMSLNDSAFIRYSRQIMLPEVGELGQQRLMEASVAIVGVGGLGQLCAQYLSAAGIGQLTLIDDDKVELSNLPRQLLFSHDDCGQYKAEVARDRLVGKGTGDNSQVSAFGQIAAKVVRLELHNAESLLSGVDLVLDCCDNFATRQHINAACVALSTPNVVAAAAHFAGQLMAFDLSKSPNSGC